MRLPVTAKHGRRPRSHIASCRPGRTSPPWRRYARAGMTAGAASLQGSAGAGPLAEIGPNRHNRSQYSSQIPSIFDDVTGWTGPGDASGSSFDRLTSSGHQEPEPTQARWMDDRLVSIQDIRSFFGLGRTAAYNLTHRPDFPEPVTISPRCYRWWASEVTAFATAQRRSCDRPTPLSARVRHCEVTKTGRPLRIEGRVRTARTRKATS